MDSWVRCVSMRAKPKAARRDSVRVGVRLLLFEGAFNCGDNIRRADTVHALRQEMRGGLKMGGSPGVEGVHRECPIWRAFVQTDWPLAKGSGLVLCILITQPCGASPPAAALGTAGQRADGVEKVMAGIGFPRDRLPSASNDDARPFFGYPICTRHSRGEVYEAGDGASHTMGVVHEPDERPQ